jgi:hypothetical protein
LTLSIAATFFGIFVLISTFFLSGVFRVVTPGFAPALIGATFSTAIFLNGLVAILAGVVANLAVEWSGSLASPFVVSAGTLVLAGLLITSSWEENYGESQTNRTGSVLTSMIEGLIVLKSGKMTLSLPVKTKVQFAKLFLSQGSHYSSSYIAFSYCLALDTIILSLGMAQTVFECCMYTFVLLYTPTLEKAIRDSSGRRSLFPLGYLFSAMMFCSMLGSLAFKFLSNKNFHTDTLLSTALLVAGTSFSFIVLNNNDATHTILAFLLFEFTTGMYFPSIGTLRAQAIPEQNRTGVMAFLRVPMNFAVCAILLNVDSLPTESIFQICSVLCFSGGMVVLWRALDPNRQVGYNPAKMEESHEL